MKTLRRDEMAAMVASHIPAGSFVNLGIGLPTLVADYLPEDRDITLHSENGILGIGPKPAPGREDPELINAGKAPVTIRLGGAYFDTSLSFAMMRGGHLDIAVLGAFEVASNGDLANWTTGDTGAPPAVGGAMDLACGAESIWVLMEHTTREGAPRIVERCGYPLTAKAVVKRIFTNCAMMDLVAGKIVVKELYNGIDFKQLQEITGAKLYRADELEA